VPISYTDVILSAPCVNAVIVVCDHVNDGAQPLDLGPQLGQLVVPLADRALPAQAAVLADLAEGPLSWLVLRRVLNGRDWLPVLARGVRCRSRGVGVKP
jgi:hypothetical protein